MTKDRSRIRYIGETRFIFKIHIFFLIHSLVTRLHEICRRGNLMIINENLLPNKTLARYFQVQYRIINKYTKTYKRLN